MPHSFQQESMWSGIYNFTNIQYLKESSTDAVSPFGQYICVKQIKLGGHWVYRECPVNKSDVWNPFPHC